MSWRPNQQTKPWPWPNALHLEQANEDVPPAWGNTAKKNEHPDGQILGGTVYKNAFPVPGEHYIYKSKKKFKDKYAKNKAKFDRKARLPPITEAMSEVSSKAGSTRSMQSWMIPRYNPDILSDVMASDDSDSDDDDYTSGRPERKYRKSGRHTSHQPSSLRHVDVIRNVQLKPEGKGQPKNTNTQVWPPDETRDRHSTEIKRNGLHRSSMNGDAVLANQLNNGSVYKERHPLGMSPTKDEESDRTEWTESLSRQQSQEGQDISRRQSTRKSQRRKKSKNNCLVTSLVIIVIIALIGAAVAAYLLLRDTSEEEKTTSPPPTNIRSLTYNILQVLKTGNFSSELENSQNPDFVTLKDEICEFLFFVPMRDYLDIYKCGVVAFREGSILVDTELSFREDRITVLKARDVGLDDTDIIAFIIDDIAKEIGAPSSQLVTDFVDKYDPSVTVKQPSTTVQPTTESEATVDNSTVTPPTNVTTPGVLTADTSFTTTTEEVTSSTLEASTTEMVPAESNVSSDSTTAGSFDGITSNLSPSSTQTTFVSSAEAQNVTESPSTV